jgi:hypothetical protein
MTPEQALSVLAGLVNSPVAKLSLSIQELGSCDLAVRTLADALKPKPEPQPAHEPGTAA